MYKRILAPIDGSEIATLSLREAVRMAKGMGAKLQILHVVDGLAFSKNHNILTATADEYREDGKRLMQDTMTWVNKEGLDAEAVLLENLSGRAADTIVERAKTWPADVIVMGTHGRRGVNRMLLGSDTELVMRTATVPVLLVPPASKS